jgi:hypothetical protein
VTPVEFHLRSNWRVQARVDEVFEVISEPLHFVRWWSAVYLRVEEVEPGDDDGVGRTLNLHTRGLLPYTLDWQATATEVNKPVRLVVEARGDLEGKGEWNLRQDGEWTKVDYDWKVFANKPWMRRLAPLLRPVFAANHHWAMQKGQQGLVEELRRIRNGNPCA